MAVMSNARRAITALVLLGLVAVAPSCAHQSAGLGAAQAGRELRALHEQWAAARIAGDVAFLERFYGEELRLQVMNGSVVSRAQDIALFDRVGRADAEVIRPEYIHDDDVMVSLYGETAVVTGVEHLRGTARAFMARWRSASPMCSFGATGAGNSFCIKARPFKAPSK